MWGKPRTSDRIGEPLPPPFPDWVLELDPNLRNIESNGIYDAFRCRAAYHKKSLSSFLSLRSVQRPSRATMIACVFFCWPAAAALVLTGILARGFGPRLGQPLGPDQRATFPERVNFLVQAQGIMVPECTDLWMAGMSGRDFAKAIYADLRQGTGIQARAIQVVLGLLLPGVYVSILCGMGMPREILSPCFWLFLAATAWLVVQIGPYSVLAGMGTVTEEIDNRRRALSRVVTRRSYWQLDPDFYAQLGRAARGVGGALVMLFLFYVATCAGGTMHDAWKQSSNPILRNIVTHSAGLTAVMLMSCANLWMRFRLRNRQHFVSDVALRLAQAGDDFELALVVNLGSGPEEVAHWMAARHRASASA